MAGNNEEDEEYYPMGFRFKPEDEELVEYYLVPSLRRHPIVPHDFITEVDVYSCHPDALTKKHTGVDQEEWYFLSPRFRMYENGVRPARKTRDDRGRWKASTASKEVDQKVVCNGITFCRSVLNYFEGVPKKEVRTKWIMLELKVPCFEIKLDKAGPNNMLDEYVLCKIYVSPQHKKKDGADEEGTSSACEGSMLSEKQAGKRPMLVRPRTLGTASTQAGCSIGCAPRAELYFGVQSQQPSGAHSSSQAPQTPQRQAGAFHGQSLAQLTPALHQPFTDARHQPFGQTTATMTMRPPLALENPLRTRQAFRPHVSLQCHYDQNYRGVRPPGRGNASGGGCRGMNDDDANRRRSAAAPGSSTPHGRYPYQSRSLTLEAAGHDGAADGRNGTPRCLNVNDEQYFVDLAMATSNPSLMTGARTQTAGAVKVEIETRETSSLNMKDAL